MNKLITSTIIIFAIITSCKNDNKENQASTILLDNKKDFSYHLDSEQIVYFLKQYPRLNENNEKLNLFYKKRNYQFAWINAEGFNENTANVIDLIIDDAGAPQIDSLFHVNKLKKLYNLLTNKTHKFKRSDSLALELELLLTVNFFEYAKRNWGSLSNVDLKSVDWFIKRKTLNYEQQLDTFLSNNSNSVNFLEPVYRQYSLLKVYLKKYTIIEKKGGWTLLDFKEITLKKGDSSLLISSIKKQLFLMEDLHQADSSIIFNNNLESALKGFQKRFGLLEDGALNEETIKALNVSVHYRIQQLLINMERCKWVPINTAGDYLAVNIPEFKLHVYHNDSLEWSCNVIVGDVKPIHNTVIFNDTLESIVFNPYWNIPNNIISNEILPAIKKNINYLVKHNLEVVNNSGNVIASSSIEWNKYSNNFPYIIRQKPGKNNALGLVKFLFPNSYNIYLHDTPQKSLFEEGNRSFSHGCIRVEEPIKLAKFLLRNDASFTDKEINTLIQSKKKIYVKVKNKVSVYIAYFTAWVDREGKLNFREDIYHNDEKMKALLFIK